MEQYVNTLHYITFHKFNIWLTKPYNTHLKNFIISPGIAILSKAILSDITLTVTFDLRWVTGNADSPLDLVLDACNNRYLNGSSECHGSLFFYKRQLRCFL